MDLGLKGKVALVTAASKGLGKATALELSREGCRLAICSRTAADIEQVGREIAQATGNEVRAYAADMSKGEEITALLDKVRQELGDPDICVVNAGGPPPGNYASTPLEKYPEAVELTLMSGVRLTHGVLPAMQAKGWGRVIFISSISVKQPIPNLLLSNMARAGLTGFMKTVATEVAPTGVTLNAVLPGMHNTDRVRQTAADAAQKQGVSIDEVLQHRAQTIPMKRIGEPAELAGMVAFLASDRAGFITGVSIQIDGGAHAGLL
jgi:3-oxoacyl-[acyl-carrier protein] reductase